MVVVVAINEGRLCSAAVRGRCSGRSEPVEEALVFCLSSWTGNGRCLQHSTSTNRTTLPFSPWALQISPSALSSLRSQPLPSHSEYLPSPLTPLPLHLPPYPLHRPLMRPYDVEVMRPPRLRLGDTLVATKMMTQNPMPSMSRRRRTTGTVTSGHL